MLAYDAWNRVVKLTDAASPAATRNVYTYDARGFRIGNTLLSGDRLDHYYTAGWQCIEDRSNGALESQYVWGLRYIDDLVQRQRDTTGNGLLDETTYALTDTQFNVVALSDTSGNIVQRISYQPYGQPTFLTASYGASTNTRNWRYLFQGLRRHYGLYDNRARLYDLLTGRFMQRDPLGYPDGLNLYAAYHVMWGGVDPEGLSAIDSICKTLYKACNDKLTSVSITLPPIPALGGGSIFASASLSPAKNKGTGSEDDCCCNVKLQFGISWDITKKVKKAVKRIRLVGDDLAYLVNKVPVSASIAFVAKGKVCKDCCSLCKWGVSGKFGVGKTPAFNPPKGGKKNKNILSPTGGITGSIDGLYDVCTGDVRITAQASYNIGIAVRVKNPVHWVFGAGPSYFKKNINHTGSIGEIELVDDNWGKLMDLDGCD